MSKHKPSDSWFLHQIADNYNWDEGTEELFDIIRNPKCDQGTALLIFWRGQPEYYLKHKSISTLQDYEKDTYLLLKEIEEKYKSGFYKIHKFKFDPQNDDNTNLISTLTEEDLKNIDPIFLQATPGRKIKPDDSFCY